ncbi:hypothetical protein G1H11_07425 [Phytoactinopolyspora alkaliphila]|uniref:DUF4352 domain-containing protein n=1 Tax=Phytoactinopolyspora alkaliphila TaxID=1783498 RepID=A0A6N9YJH6_9ACTN|nr:hypothetical protein [Phytoactinopolyspora alkaliphila]NED95143.1 hypothetical protein [Phytoactinopolyspora alkaliphila]
MRKTLASRRVIAALAGSALVFGLAACSSDDDAPEDTTTEEVTDEVDSDELDVEDVADDEDTDEDTDEAEEAEDEPADSPNGSGEHTAAPWTDPITLPGEQIATIEGDNFQVEIYQVGVEPSPKDGMLVDPDSNKPILAEGDDIVFVNYVVTNTSSEPINLSSSLVAVVAKYADWEYLQGMDSITDRDLYEAMELDTNAVAERSEEGVYPLAPGESYSQADNFMYKTDSPVIFEARLTPVDDEGELLSDERQEESVEVTLS